MEDEKQEDKKMQVYPTYPWDHVKSSAREAQEQPHKLLPLQKAPTWRNNECMRVNKPFSYQKVQKFEDL